MSQGEYAQQRRVPRYSFVAPAAVLPEKGAPVGGNIKELSLYGCYMDAASTLAPRTKVLVKIFMPGEYFEANATVAYANPALGLGLVFRDVKPAFRSVLRKWLLMAMQLSQPSTLQGVTVDEMNGEALTTAIAQRKSQPGNKEGKNPTSSDFSAPVYVRARLGHFNLAYSDLACSSGAKSESAFFHNINKSS